MPALMKNLKSDSVYARAALGFDEVEDARACNEGKLSSYVPHMLRALSSFPLTRIISSATFLPTRNPLGTVRR